MKTKNILSIIAVLILGSFIGRAESPETQEVLKLSFKSNDIINLVYNNTSKSYPKVNILDSKNELVFSERITNNFGVMRLYDFSSLPEGEYTFEVIDNGVKTVKTLEYHKETKSENNLKIEVAAIDANGKYRLECKGVKDGPVYVTIYSKSQGLIYEDLVESKKDFSRIYDLSKLQNDAYVFEIVSADSAASQEVSLDSELSLSK